MNIKNIQKVLIECYSKDLCYPKVQRDWNENNRCFGMCAITSLIINDYFGGDICKIYVDGIIHYFNLIENNIRLEEDYEMLKKLWPKPMAKIVMHFYKNAIKTNS